MDSKQTGLAELDRISGFQLSKVRSDLGLTQSRLSDLLSVSRSAVNLCESQDRVVPREWIEKLHLLSKYRSFVTKIHMPKNRHWRFSKNFSRTPDFEVLPNCPCTIEKCRLDPEKDVDRGDLGHFWLFRGRECKKRRYLNEDGSIVQAPPSLRRKAEVPVERCSHCGKARGLAHSSHAYEERIAINDGLTTLQACKKRKIDVASRFTPSEYLSGL